MKVPLFVLFCIALLYVVITLNVREGARNRSKNKKNEPEEVEEDVSGDVVGEEEEEF